MNGHASLQFRSDPALFAAVRRFIAQAVVLAGGSSEDAPEFEIAAGEILTNAFQHAYRRGHGPLQVDLTYDDHEVELSVRDEGGAGARTPVIPSVLKATDEHRGLYLVGKLTDHVDILDSGDGGGKIVRMTKRLRKFRDFSAARSHEGRILKVRGCR